MLVGSSSAGKSSFLLRFVDSEFTGDFMSTIGVDFVRSHNIFNCDIKIITKKIKTIKAPLKEKKEAIVKLQIWDIMGGRTKFELYII